MIKKKSNGVFVDVNSSVLRNITVGDNSIVGAGFVVAKDNPLGVIVMGNPAKIIRKVQTK